MSSGIQLKQVVKICKIKGCIYTNMENEEWQEQRKMEHI